MLKPLHRSTVIQPETIGYAQKQQAQMRLEDRQRTIGRKIENFCSRAIYPQTLTLPRDPLMVPDGVRIVKWVEGRNIDAIRENGIRVIVLEANGVGTSAKCRFHMSPLFGSRHDAESWARSIGAA